MKTISFIRDVSSDSLFAVIVNGKQGTRAFGVSPTGSAWAKQCNSRKLSLDDIKKSIDVMLYASSPKTLTEDEVGSLSGQADDRTIIEIRKLLDEETKSFKLQIKSEPFDWIPREENDDTSIDDDDVRLSISDAPIHVIDIEFKQDAIHYKAKAFRLDSQVSSMRLEAKGARAVFDPKARNGIGAWRCPDNTPYGGQFTNRFGRGCTWGVSRRIGRAFTAFAGQDLGKIRKIGETFEGFGDRNLQRAGERSNRRRDRRVARLNRTPIQSRIAERLAQTLDSAAEGLRGAASDSKIKRSSKKYGDRKWRKGQVQGARAYRRQKRRDKQKLQQQQTPTPAKRNQNSAQFFNDLKKRNKNIPLEDAQYLFDSKTRTWLTRDDKSDADWLDDIDTIVKPSNSDGRWVPVTEEQVQYLTQLSIGTVKEPNNRDFRKSINEYRKKLKQDKKRTRQQTGTSPKKSPLAQRLADRAAAKAQSVRVKPTGRKMRGRKPRSTESRRERVARALSRTATQVATDRGTAKQTWNKIKKQRKSNRAQRRDVTLNSVTTSKFFAKTGVAKLMPDISTLPQQQQDDVRAAVKQAYDQMFDLWQERTLGYIERYKRSRRADAKTRKFKSKPGFIDLDEMTEAAQQSGIINSYVQGQWNNDAHNFQVLAEIVTNDDYSLVDELKPSKRDAILNAAGITPPPKRTRKKKQPPASPPPSAPPAPPTPPPAPPTPPPAPSTPPTPPAAPPAPPTPPPAPPTPPTPSTPPPTPSPASPPTPKPLPTKPPTSSAAPSGDVPLMPEVTPVEDRDMSIDGVEPAGTIWRGVDVSGLKRIDRPNNEPLFIDPATNRYIDFSEAIVVDNPIDAVRFMDYPKTEKGKTAYPKKRADFNGKTKDREIFPGTSPQAFDSWYETLEQFPSSTPGMTDSVQGFRTIRDVLVSFDEDFDENKPLSTVARQRLLNILNTINMRMFTPTAGNTWQARPFESQLNSPISDNDKTTYSAAVAQAINTLTNNLNSSYSDLDLPEFILEIPAPHTPYDDSFTGGYAGRGSFLNADIPWSRQSTYPKTRIAHVTMAKALVTKDDNDLLFAYDKITSALDEYQKEMDALLARWRRGDKSQTIPRRIAQLGNEIDALERMLKYYFAEGDTISAAVQRRKRAQYAANIIGLNKARERAERRAKGELKVGGKLQSEDLAPKPGVVRTTPEILKTLEDHKSPTLFPGSGSLDPNGPAPLLTEDEIDFYDQVQDAYLTARLPDGRTVREAGASGSEPDKSIAELHTMLELNGYNDPPVQVSTDEARAMRSDTRENGKPAWFLMSRYLNTNSNTPGKTPTDMVDEYREGPRFPTGGGATAGGRGDNFAGGTGFSGYGPAGIAALVSAEAKITHRQFLMQISSQTQEKIRELANKRHVSLGSRVAPAFTGTPLDDDELMDLVDSLKQTLSFPSMGGYGGQRLQPGDPQWDEAVAISSTLMEHWLQLELAKRRGDDLTDEDVEWNSRLLRMQQSIYHMDEAQIAVFAGYDGYFSQAPSYAQQSSYSNDDWSLHADRDFNDAQVMWLNRTALAVLERALTHAEISQL